MPSFDRDDWVRAALAMAADRGVGAVKVEPLATSLGVTKGSFYHHFDDRQALLDALLAQWARQDTEQVIELVEAEPTATPAEALHRLVDLAFGDPGELDGVETAIREWAATDSDVAATVSGIDERRLGYVTDLLVAAGVATADAKDRADLLYRIIIGEYLWRRYGGVPVDRTAVHAFIHWAATP